MKSKLSFLSLLLLVLFSTQISYANEAALARKAVSENAAEASPAIEELRALGPAGLKALMDEYRDEIARHITNPSAASDEQWQRITTALDTVAQQKNSYTAGLYWYTDLDEAKKASKAFLVPKPILSLRLLGKLTDEFSCANSRFFRTVLYSNAGISHYLSEHYVLHWQSVRAVPKVTIDYGDGRRLERTLTGNSIHYILDSEGRPIEAIPGLYGPQAFKRALENAEMLVEKVAGSSDVQRKAVLMDYYGWQYRRIMRDWALDINRIGGKVPAGFRIDNNGDALSIAPRAVTKAVTETPILRATDRATESLGQVTDEAAWKKIAELHSSDMFLDSRSIGLIKRQNPTLSEPEMTRLLMKFHQLIALDTVRNEYLLRSKLYTWLNRDATDVKKLNDKVYAELFLTPDSDPWLGLVSTDVYTALDNGGIVKP